MKTLRWGILGTGRIAAHFAETAARMGDEVCLYAVASRSMEHACAFGDAHGIPVRYGSYEALAADPRVDIVYVATPHSRHAQDMRLLIEAGKSILCEKSFAVNEAQAQEIFALARRRGVFVMEAFWTAFLPVYRDVGAWLTQGRIGGITALTAQYGYTTDRAARKFDPGLAGGALLDIGVYAVGLCCMLLGNSFDSVHGELVLNDQGTDAADAVLLRRGRTVAQLTCAIGTDIPVYAALFGTKGRIEIPDFKNPQRATLLENGQPALTVERPFEVNGFEYEIREAMDCVRAGRLQSSRMPPERSLAMLRIMDEVRRQGGLRFPCE